MKSLSIEQLKNIFENGDNIIERDLSGVTKEYMKKYYEEVVLRRALSDPRDGLKPVQRKGLYTCFVSGYNSSKKHVKSAKIVGDLIGCFSPHGDQSAYDALTDMSCDWKKNIPLIDFHGGNGSILDSDPASAMRYCIVGDTLIPTRNGYYNIEELANIKTELNSDNQINTEIYSLDNNINSSNILFNSGYHKTKKITTESDYTIEGSYNHPLLILNEKLEFEWKLIENIEEGDCLVLGGDVYDCENDVVNENEAILLGSLVSEGYVSHNQCYYRIGFTNSDTRFLNKVKECFKDVFNINEDKIFLNKQSGENEVYDLCVYGKEKYELMKEKYNFYQTSKEKEIPDCILKSSKRIQAIFLKYLFEGDGYFYNNKINNKINTYIQYDSISKKLIYQIRILLLNSFGIISSIHEDKRKRNIVYRIFIKGFRNIKKFKENIGFVYEKQNKLINLVDNNKSKIRDSKGYYIPYVKEYINKNTNGKKFSSSISSNQNLKSNLERLKNDLSEEDYLKIKRIVDCNYFYLKVNNIETIKEEKIVYSIRVNSECHSFIGGGFINHNTEMRTNKITEKYLLKNLNEKTVDYVNNYDNSLREPLVLPSAFPLVLINGSFGIAAGYQANIPPANPLEVLNNTIHYLETGEFKVCMPDYPTGGIIVNADEVKKTLLGTTKKSYSIKLNCKTEIDGNDILVTEIPYQTNVTKVLTKLVDGVKDNLSKKNINKSFDGIKDIIDESDKTGICIRIVCKRGYDPQTVLNQLLNNTNTLKANFPIILIGSKNESEFLIFDSQKEILDEWIKFRYETITRIKHSEISKAKKAINLLEGMNIILGEHLEEYLEILKTSNGKTEVLERVMNSFGTTYEQTDHVITNVPHYKINRLDVQEIENELKQKNEEIENHISYIKDRNKITELIISELKEIKKLFKNCTRKTQLINLKQDEIESTIPDENFDFFITENNFIKKLKVESSTQKRGGKGQSIGKISDGDSLKFTLNANSRDKLYFFTNKGKLFSLNCYDIPETPNKNRLGNSLKQFLNIDDNESIVNIIPISKDELEENSIKLSFVSRNNKIKLVSLDSYVRSYNVIGCALNEDDELISVEKINIDYKPSLLCFLNNGNCVHLDLKNVPCVNKTAIGVLLFNNDVFKDDENIRIVSVAPISSETTDVCLITKNGLIKRVDINEFPLQNRGCKGIMGLKLKEDDELVKGININKNDEELKITSNKKCINLKLEEVSIYKRPTYGNKSKEMDEDEIILDIIVNK